MPNSGMDAIGLAETIAELQAARKLRRCAELLAERSGCTELCLL